MKFQLLKDDHIQVFLFILIKKPCKQKIRQEKASSSGLKNPSYAKLNQNRWFSDLLCLFKEASGEKKDEDSPISHETIILRLTRGRFNYFQRRGSIKNPRNNAFEA